MALPWKQVLSRHLPHFVIPTNSKTEDYVLVYDAIEMFFEYFCPDQLFQSNPNNSYRYRTRINDLSIPAYLVTPFIGWFKEAENQGFDDLEDLDSTEIFNAISEYQSKELLLKESSPIHGKSFNDQPVVKEDVKKIASPTISKIKETAKPMVSEAIQSNQDVSSSSSVELTDEEDGDSLEEKDLFKESNKFLNNPLSRAIHRSRYPYNEESTSCKEIPSKLTKDESSKSKSSLELKSKQGRKKESPVLFGIAQTTSSTLKRKESKEFNIFKESKQAKKDK